MTSIVPDAEMKVRIHCTRRKMNKLRRQCYNGACNISGQRTDVAKHIVFSMF